MQKFLFKNIIIPAYHKYKNHNYLKHYYDFKKRDKLTIEELQAIQWKKLKKLLNFCYEEIPYYRRLFSKNNRDYKKMERGK